MRKVLLSALLLSACGGEVGDGPFVNSGSFDDGQCRDAEGELVEGWSDRTALYFPGQNDNQAAGLRWCTVSEMQECLEFELSGPATECIVAECTALVSCGAPPRFES